LNVINEGAVLMELVSSTPSDTTLSTGSKNVIVEYNVASRYEDMTMNNLSILVEGAHEAISYIELDFSPYSGAATTHEGVVGSGGLVKFKNLDWNISDSNWSTIRVRAILSDAAREGDVIIASVNPAGYGPGVIGNDSGAWISAINIIPDYPITSDRVSVGYVR